MKVPQEAQGAGSPQLTPEVTGGADIVVVTVATVTFKASSFGKGPQPVLTFDEFPDHALRIGKRGTDRLIEQWGDETDEWMGKRVPLRKAREEIGKNAYVVYQVAPVDEWAALLKRAPKGKKSR